MKKYNSPKSVEMEIAGRGYYTFLPEAQVPVDIENQTGIQMEIEVHTFQAGRIAVILRPKERKDRT